MTKIQFELDGKQVEAINGETIWQVAKRQGREIPHLCYSPEPDYRPDGNCRACMVEVEGERVLAASCKRTPSVGMKVKSASPRAVAAQKMVMELLVADQPARETSHDPDSKFWHWAEKVEVTESRFPAAERWHGDARPILRELVDHADLLFAEQRDIALILGRSFEDVPAAEQFRVAGTLALETFSRLKRIATTVRVQRSVDEHELSAALLSREGLRTTRTYSIGRIIDRIGSGDAFAAGILHGVRTQLEDQDCVDFGLAAAVLKHSIPGDFNLVGIAEVQNLLRDAGFTVRR